MISMCVCKKDGDGVCSPCCPDCKFCLESKKCTYCEESLEFIPGNLGSWDEPSTPDVFYCRSCGVEFPVSENMADSSQVLPEVPALT